MFSSLCPFSHTYLLKLCITFKSLIIKLHAWLFFMLYEVLASQENVSDLVRLLAHGHFGLAANAIAKSYG